MNIDKPVLDVQVNSRVFKLSGGKQLHAVDKLAFSLDTNSFTCIVGPSGCGKTTTLRMILGLDVDFEGTIVQPGRERVATVFQEPRLLPWRTVEQNIRLVLPASRIDESLDALLQQLGLEEVRSLYPTQLSLGLARRAALARAFILEPELLILDEPFVSLDDATAERLRQLLLSLWKTHHTTALMVTHNIKEAAFLADRILVFSARPGRILNEIPLNTAREQRDRHFLESVENQVAEIYHSQSSLE
ncbi:MAG: ATP-binding cassette domain-containing protein [Granulosicoccus sp.]|nr:ATP-binding cassette domain-containing protein [Granulosicoccus sp.]